MFDFVLLMKVRMISGFFSSIFYNDSSLVAGGPGHGKKRKDGGGESWGGKKGKGGDNR